MSTLTQATWELRVLLVGPCCPFRSPVEVDCHHLIFRLLKKELAVPLDPEIDWKRFVQLRPFAKTCRCCPGLPAIGRLKNLICRSSCDQRCWLCSAGVPSADVRHSAAMVSPIARRSLSQVLGAGRTR
jgi:hypothetical protein